MGSNYVHEYFRIQMPSDKRMKCNVCEQEGAIQSFQEEDK